jgi:hypothetical protein
LRRVGTTAVYCGLEHAGTVALLLERSAYTRLLLLTW